MKDRSCCHGRGALSFHVEADAPKASSTRRSTKATSGDAAPATSPAARAARDTPETSAARLQPKIMSAKQTAMVKALERYICTIKPRANDVASLAARVEVKYARARACFEAQHWEEAAAAFPRERHAV